MSDRGRKFAQHNERVREHLQYMFAYGIANAAVTWYRAGADPTHEWAELYDFVCESDGTVKRA